MLHATHQYARTLDASNALKTQALLQIHPMGDRNVPDIRSVHDISEFCRPLTSRRVRACLARHVPHERTRLGPAIMARAVVDKLIGSLPSKLENARSTHLLIQRVRVKRAWCDVSHRLTHLKILLLKSRMLLNSMLRKGNAFCQHRCLRREKRVGEPVVPRRGAL